MKIEVSNTATIQEIRKLMISKLSVDRLHSRKVMEEDFSDYEFLFAKSFQSVILNDRDIISQFYQGSHVTFVFFLKKGFSLFLIIIIIESDDA